MTNNPRKDGEAHRAKSVAIMTLLRDIKNLEQTAKYLPHDDDGCRECTEMNAWLAKTIKQLRRQHDRSNR